MAIVPMQKVALVGMTSDKEKIIQHLHEEGVMEICETTNPVTIDHTGVEFREAEVQFAIQTLKDFASKETQSIAAKKTNPDDVIKTAQHTDVRGIVDALHKLEEDDTNSERKIQEAQILLDTLQPWSHLPFPLNSKKESVTSMRILGTMPESNVEAFRDSLKEKSLRADLAYMQTTKSSAYVCAIVWKQDMHLFEEAATMLGWSAESLPEMDGTPAQLCEQAQIDIQKLTKKKLTNAEERAKLSVELPNLLKVQTFMKWLDAKQSVREATKETERTMTILGWIPKKNFEKLETAMKKVSGATMLMKIKPDEGEDAPILLKNNILVTPFESVTSLYGLPTQSEMDPTAALSPFFILYFALCLTDAGYGAVLALVFGVYLLVTRKSIQEAKLFWLLFLSGIVTVLVSIPFGGWFGVTPEQAPAIFTRETSEGLMFHGQIWNLNKQSGINFLQYLSLALGLTHLFFGMLLAGLHKWHHNQKAAAFWVDFTSHILLGSILFFAFAPESLKDIAQYVLYAAVALMVWGKGHGAKWYVRPIMGLLGMVNFAIGMISNGLSYLRILALGLVTGAIAAAVNQVALEMSRLFPLWVGIPVIIIICFFGHLVSIALNALGSFIHSGRLQFIEFFSQFFEGGGREYSPFRRSIS